MAHFAVLALDGVFDTGFSSVLDTLDTANGLAGVVGRSSAGQNRVSRVGVRRSIKSGQGFSIPLELAESIPRPDVVIVPAIGAKTPESLGVALERKEISDAGEQLVQWKKEGTKVAAICTGTFVLAKAGLLDGRRATTTWWLAPMLRASFPRVEVDEAQMIVESRGVFTAGAALAHLDMVFHLLRRQSPSLARLVARHMLFDDRPSQAAYILPDYLQHSDPLVDKFEEWARKHLADFAVDRAAKSVGVSERTLERRLQAVLGKSPLSYVQDLRVERATHYLSTTKNTVEEIAERVGYRDGVTLRTLLKKKTGRGIRELRGR